MEEAGMRARSRTGIALAAACIAAGSICIAQAPASPPAPSPEQKQLQRFVGTWTGKGDMKPGPFGPGGVMNWTETCDWFTGGYSVVCKSDGKGPMGAVKGLSIVGYSSEEKVYTYYGVDSTGFSDMSKGTLKGNVWSFESHGTMGGQPMHGR